MRRGGGGGKDRAQETPLEDKWTNLTVIFAKILCHPPMKFIGIQSLVLMET